jgi:hypothetical protein
MKRIAFIRPAMWVDFLVAEKVEEILPKLLEAASAVSEPEKAMTPVAAEKL